MRLNISCSILFKFLLPVQKIKKEIIRRHATYSIFQWNSLGRDQQS